MFKFFKDCLPDKEKKYFDITLKPFIAFSLINTFFIALASKNIGSLNENMAVGMLWSWAMYVAVFLYSLLFFKPDEEEHT